MAQVQIILTDVPTKDTIVPAEAFKKLAAYYNDTSWFDKAMPNFKAAAKNAINTENMQLKKKLADTWKTVLNKQDGAEVWFCDVFLGAFGGKVTDEAKTAFEMLQKDGLKGGEQWRTFVDEVSRWKDAQLAKANTIAEACVEANKSIDPIVAAAGRLSEALAAEAKAAPAAAPETAPPTPAPAVATVVESAAAAAAQAEVRQEGPAPTFDEFLNRLIAMIDAANGDPPDLARALGYDGAVKAHLHTASGKPELGPRVKSVLSGGNIPQIVLSALSYLGTNAQKVLALQESLDFSRLNKLLREGKITQEDYGRITRRYRMLVEATPVSLNALAAQTIQPAAANQGGTAPAQNPDAAAPKPEDNPWSKVLNDISNQGKAVQTLLATIQDVAAKGKQQDLNLVGSLLESKRKLIKAAVKRSVLRELVRRKKEQPMLNEFLLLGAIIAALAAVAAWVAKKYVFNGGSYWGNPNGGNHPSPDQAEIDRLTKELAAAQVAAQKGDGTYVDQNGKPVRNPAEVRAEYVKQLTGFQKTWAEIETAATPLTTASPLSAIVQPLVVALAQALSQKPSTKIAAVIAALQTP